MSFQNEKLCIFLDDERNPEDVKWFNYDEDLHFYIVRTFKEFKTMVNNLKCIGAIDNLHTLSFDHDLQDFHDEGEYTGYDCVKWFCDYCFDNGISIPSSVVFHSKNIIGEENMRCYYFNAIKHQGN